MTPVSWLRRGLLVTALVLVCGGMSAGQTGPLVPANLQAVLFSKILSFDRSLTSRAGVRLEVLVLYQPEFPKSRRMAEDFSAAFGGAGITEIAGRPLVITMVPFTKLEDLQTALTGRNADVVYIAPLRAISVRRLTAAIGTRSRVISAVRRHVEDGAAIGVELRSGKPHIIVNLDAARARGMDLSAQLLKLAEVITP